MRLADQCRTETSSSFYWVSPDLYVSLPPAILLADFICQGSLFGFQGSWGRTLPPPPPPPGVYRLPLSYDIIIARISQKHPRRID